MVDVLDRHQIGYMVTGSIASSIFGQPRSTHDIDLVVALAAEHARDLLIAFPPPTFYLSEASILDAIRGRSMFNLLDISGGDKVDFWILQDDPFDRSRFARRRWETIGGKQVAVSSPEDTILAKLRWSMLSDGSEKQFHDAKHVFEVQQNSLDLNYLSHWASQLGADTLWRRLLDESEPV